MLDKVFPLCLCDEWAWCVACGSRLTRQIILFDGQMLSFCPECDVALERGPDDQREDILAQLEMAASDATWNAILARTGEWRDNTAELELWNSWADENGREE